MIHKDIKKKDSIKDKNLLVTNADPFSALFECATLNISIEEWIETCESRRLRQKSMQNHIGKLHEVAISCLPDWQLSASTADVENPNLKIIAEIKNKYNTMNSSSALATYRKLEHLVDGIYEGYQSYIVQIIPKPNAKAYSSNFIPSDSSKKNAKASPSRNDIKIIDGESFYSLANKGDINTLKNIYFLMGELLNRYLGNKDIMVKESSSYEDFINSICPSKRV